MLTNCAVGVVCSGKGSGVRLDDLYADEVCEGCTINRWTGQWVALYILLGVCLLGVGLMAHTEIWRTHSQQQTTTSPNETNVRHTVVMCTNTHNEAKAGGHWSSTGP